jgi:hypothetical protein
MKVVTTYVAPAHEREGTAAGQKPAGAHDADCMAGRTEVAPPPVNETANFGTASSRS